MKLLATRVFDWLQSLASRDAEWALVEDAFDVADEWLRDQGFDLGSPDDRGEPLSVHERAVVVETVFAWQEVGS